MVLGNVAVKEESPCISFHWPLASLNQFSLQEGPATAVAAIPDSISTDDQTIFITIKGVDVPCPQHSVFPPKKDCE